MKILVLSHVLPYPPHGGAVQRIYNLLNKVNEEHEVHLISFTQRAILPTKKGVANAEKKLSELFASVQAVEIPTDGSRFRWYLLLALNVFSLLPYSVWRFKSARFRSLIREMVADGNFDVVHIDTIALAQYLRDTKNTPAVLNHHNAESILLSRRGFKHHNILAGLYMRYQAWKLKRYEKAMMPRFGAHLVVSEEDRSYFTSMAEPSSVFVVPNGTDTDYFSPAAVQKQKEIVFVGGMTWYPNKDAMTYFCREIWPLVKRKEPNVILNVIGRAPSAEIREFGKKDKRINVHGFVDDMRTLTRRALVFVVPIRVGGGTRLKIVDAMALGKAIVSTAVGAEGIAYEDGVDIIIADTPSDFADKVIRVIQDDNLRNSLEIAARKKAMSKYSWDVIAPKQIAAYLHAIKRLETT